MYKLVLLGSLLIFQCFGEYLNDWEFSNEIDSDLSDDATYFKGFKNNLFDWSLIKAEFTSKNKTILMSPYSVKLLLSLISQGTDENSKTYKELSIVLPGLIEKIDQYRYINQTLSSLLKRVKGCEIKYASQIFKNYSIILNYHFEDIAKYIYNSSSIAINFNNNNSFEKINNLVSKQTKGRIKKIFDEDDVTDAAVILSNVIFFKGTWKLPFRRSLTRDEPYYVNSEKIITVQTMHDISYYYYIESKELNLKILRLEYVGGKYAMYIVLSNDKNGFDNLLNTVTPEQILKLQADMQEEEVFLYLPKFKIDYKLELKETLKKLGIRKIFEKNANFNKLSEDPVKISNVLQKAAIVVNEKTKSANPETDFELRSKSHNRKYFIADHPFLFFIEDETMGSLIFAGKIYEPNFKFLNH